MTKKHKVFKLDQKPHWPCVRCKTIYPDDFYNLGDNCCKKCAKAVLGSQYEPIDHEILTMRIN